MTEKEESGPASGTAASPCPVRAVAVEGKMSCPAVRWVSGDQDHGVCGQRGKNVLEIWVS